MGRRRSARIGRRPRKRRNSAARAFRHLGTTQANPSRTRADHRLGVSYDVAALYVIGEDEDYLIEADTIVVCAGQELARELHDVLAALDVIPRLIGGAEEASELDAARAIAQATKLAISL